jgi:hypothetical protein
MPHISQNPLVRQLFHEFSADTQSWVNQHLSPERLDALVRGKAEILIKTHPELKPSEIEYLSDCFNQVYQAARKKNIYIPRPVVSVLDVIAQAKAPAKTVVVKATTRDHGTQTN